MMMPASRFASLLRCGTLALCLLPVVAPAQADSLQEAPASVEGSVALALTTASEAHQRSDREELAQALGIIDRAGARPLQEWDGQDPVPQWRADLADAEAVAETPVYRGSPLGPGYRAGKVSGGASDHFEQVFLSGQKASIALSSSSASPLSLRVIDRDHRPVCESDSSACQWIPLFTQRYSIMIYNRGNKAAEYFLVVD